MNKIRISLILSLLFSLIFVSCSNDRDVQITSIKDMKERELAIAVPGDLDLNGKIYEACPKAKIVPIEDLLMLNALSNGKIDVAIHSRKLIERYIKDNNLDNLVVLDEPFTTFNINLGLSKNEPVANYEQRVNECIEHLERDGILNDMYKRWLEENSDTMPEIKMPANPEKTLKVVTFGQEKPYSFLKDNKLCGFDVEIAMRVASYLNCDIQIEAASYTSMFTGLETGKYDMISANLFTSPEHNANMLLSKQYDKIDIVLAVRNTEADKASTGKNFINQLSSTFITESRWKLLLTGLIQTLAITVFGFALANIVGIVLCYYKMSNKVLLNVIAEVFSRIVLGTPTVVFLLILFYVVFGKSRIDGIWVSVIGFGIIFGENLSTLFTGALKGIDKGQNEAALALGFTKTQAFFGIILPQVTRAAIPGYFGSLITLMKSTAIVGYISVVDLTKVSDLIRASTYEAFFPLLSIALVYFIIASLLISLMKIIQKRLEPKRQEIKRIAK